MDTRNDLEKFADSLTKQARNAIEVIPYGEGEMDALLWGIVEFRCDVTQAWPQRLLEYYDRGREMAHVLTLRHFETGG